MKTAAVGLALLPAAAAYLPMATLSPNLLPIMGFNPNGDLGPFTIYRTKRRGVVWFPRSPPTKPASYLQRRQRNRWRFAARTWSASTPTIRANWNTAADLANLRISGYNLFTYWQTTKRRDIILTVQRISGVQLL